DGRMIGKPQAEPAHQGLLRLILETLPVAPPMLDEVQSGIQHRRRIAHMRSMLDSNGLGERVRAVERWLVAGCTAYVPFKGPPRIEEQHPSERHSTRRGRQLVGAQCLRQRFEERLGPLEKSRVILGLEPR